jgi:hypothetical protein
MTNTTINKNQDDCETYTFEATAIIPFSLKINAKNYDEALKKSGLANNNLAINCALLQFSLQDGSKVKPKVLDFEIEIDGITEE